MYCWINGQFIDQREAKVSAFDAGFQHGVGLFETMLAHNGRVFRARQHMQRLAASARELRLTEQLHVEPLIEALHLVLRKNEMDQARIRLTITGGDLNRSLQRTFEKPASVDPTLLIVAQPPTQYPQELFEQGVLAVIADGRVNPLDPHAGHKTLSYWPRISALQLGATEKAGEALWFSLSNHLSSGSVSNVFLVKDGSLRTPFARGEEVPGAIPSPVLPGITRAAMIELAEAGGIEMRRRMLDINDVLGADEVFLTNSSWGVLPVVQVEREHIGAGTVGPITNQLRSEYLAMVERETPTM